MSRTQRRDLDSEYSDTGSTLLPPERNSESDAAETEQGSEAEEYHAVPINFLSTEHTPVDAVPRATGESLVRQAISNVNSDKGQFGLPKLDSIGDTIGVSALHSFMKATGLSQADLDHSVMPSRTLTKRTAREEPLDIDETDRLIRLARLFAHTVEVFHGDRERAVKWFHQPSHPLGGRTPIEMVRTERGGRAIEEILLQIDYGIVA